jgi:hypothetical protein
MVVAAVVHRRRDRLFPAPGPSALRSKRSTRARVKAAVGRVATSWGTSTFCVKPSARVALAQDLGRSVADVEVEALSPRKVSLRQTSERAPSIPRLLHVR